MINIAIVEDSKSDYENLLKHINRYGREHDIEFLVDYYDNGNYFLDEYKPSYKIVFMDIEMPYINGIEVMEKLRKVDEKIIIIIVSNSSKYAVKGYTVNALGYVVKPIEVYNFDNTLNKAISLVEKDDDAFIITPYVGGGLMKVFLKDIYYIEVLDHILNIHLKNKIIEKRGTLKELEDKLLKYGFARCDKSIIVNLSHVEEIEKNLIHINDSILVLSRTRKKDFIDAYINFLGDNS